MYAKNQEVTFLSNVNAIRAGALLVVLKFDPRERIFLQKRDLFIVGN